MNYSKAGRRERRDGPGPCKTYAPVVLSSLFTRVVDDRERITLRRGGERGPGPCKTYLVVLVARTVR